MSITVKDLNDLMLQGYKIEDEIAGYKAIIKGLSESLGQVEKKIAFVFTEMGISSFKCARGTVVLSQRFHVKKPETPEDQEKFFNHLKERNLFDVMVDIPAPRIQSYYKEELEIAKEQGNFEFSIPGLKSPTFNEYISFKKG